MTRPSSRSLPVLAGAALLFSLLAQPAAANSQEPAGACTDDGVTVVVDLTDLDGEVEVGCAEGEPASGREALKSAGFTTTDSEPGLICAIDDQPDPCPEEFDGNYWAYYTAEEGEEWTASTEGADTAEPVPGSFEGWRYNDGSEPPAFDPAGDPQPDAAEPSADAESGQAEDDAAGTAEDDATDDAQDAAAEAESESGSGPWLVVGIVAVLVVGLAVVGWVVSRRRQQH